VRLSVRLSMRLCARARVCLHGGVNV
jgi:hypothetical protein